jgi:hypothetical protein
MYCVSTDHTFGILANYLYSDFRYLGAKLMEVTAKYTLNRPRITVLLGQKLSEK